MCLAMYVYKEGKYSFNYMDILITLLCLSQEQAVLAGVWYKEIQYIVSLFYFIYTIYQHRDIISCAVDTLKNAAN